MRVIKIPSSESDEASVLEDSEEVCWDRECCLVDVCLGIASREFLAFFSARASATAHQPVFFLFFFLFIKAQQFADFLHLLAEILLAHFSSALWKKLALLQSQLPVGNTSV